MQTVIHEDGPVSKSLEDLERQLRDVPRCTENFQRQSWEVTLAVKKRQC